jgi:integrase
MAQNTRYLKKRRQGWYLNLPVPAELKDRIGSSGIISETLRTRDLKVAQTRRWERVAYYHESFKRLRGEAALTSQDIEQIATRAFYKFLEDTADASDRGKPLVRAAPTADLRNLSPEHAGLYLLEEDLQATIEYGDFSWIYDQFESELKKAGAAVDPTGPQYREIGEALAMALLSAIDARRAVLSEEQYEKPEVFNTRLIDPRTAKVRRGLKRPQAGDPDAPRFLEATELYIAETNRDPEHGLSPHTIYQNKAVFRLFSEYYDDPLLAAITRQDVSKFLDAIATLDRHWSRSPKTRGLSVHELLEQRQDPTGVGLTNKTVNRYVTTLAQPWKWAHKRGYVSGENPFAEQARRISSSKGGSRASFTVEELNKLFGASLFTNTASAQRLRPNRHTINTVHLWVPLIALFTGMRIEEICKLTTGAVKQEGGIWYFDVRDDEAGRVKNRSSVRRVPVHSELVRCGFLEYLAAVSGHPSGQLFPALNRRGPDRKFSFYYTRRFTDFRRRCGIDRPGVVFHSFRNTVATALENARVPVNEAAEVLGHAKAGMSYGVYSQGLGLVELQEVVERIQYPGLEIGHLHAQ